MKIICKIEKKKIMMNTLLNFFLYYHNDHKCNLKKTFTDYFAIIILLEVDNFIFQNKLDMCEY